MWDFCTALGMAASMFTLLPLRRARWEERLRPLALALLPLIGLGVGALWRLLALVAGALPAHLGGALIAAAPWLLTGFIHLDGFLDASDALLSWRSREERLRILKDVHAGALAIAALAVLALFQFAAAMELRHAGALTLLPVLSRCASARCALTLRPLGHSEYAGMAGAAKLARIPDVAALASLAALALLWGWAGLGAGIATAIGYAIAMRTCIRALGGFSGDLAGYALTIGELCGMIALAIL